MHYSSLRKIFEALRLFPLPEAYESGGRQYIYDQCRRKSVMATPEEKIRQLVVHYLRRVLHTPIRCMQTEVSLRRYGYTNRNDRADIIILRPDGETVLAVIECKAPQVPIGEGVINQTLRYAKALNAEYAFAANGSELAVYGFDKRKGYVPIKAPGSYGKMCRSFNNAVPQIRTIDERPALQKLNSIKFVRKYYDDYIGRQTDDKLLPFIANLCDGLRDISVRMKPAPYSYFTLKEDLGVRTMEITVPGGGTFNNNNYRMFKVKNSDGEEFAVGLAVSVYGGAGSEKTMIAAAVDNGSRCHHALQLILDTNVRISNDNIGIYYEITHSGKINVGRRGCARNSETVNFVKNEMPSLIGTDGRIHLGKIHDGELISSASREFVELFDCLVSYVLILEKFRAVKLRE